MTSLPQPPAGSFEGAVHRFAVRIYFEDTDLTGVAYHANYLRWFERARSDMVRLLGIDQRAAQEAGEGSYAVVELTIRYVSPARLDDVVLVESRVEEMRSASCRIRQRALRGDTLLSEATVRVGFVDPAGHPRRQPAEWRAAFASVSPPASESRS